MEEGKKKKDYFLVKEEEKRMVKLVKRRHGKEVTKVAPYK